MKKIGTKVAFGVIAVFEAPADILAAPFMIPLVGRKKFVNVVKGRWKDIGRGLKE